MKGNDKIIALLNELLTNELTAINQYFIHAKMCRNWGLESLAKKVWDESIDEMKHADRVIDRILYFDGVPNLQKLHKLTVGQTVGEQFSLDLAMEKKNIAFLNENIEVCRSAGDHGSMELMLHILEAEEEHAEWLETQLSLIERVGEAHYMAQQIRPS